MPNIIKDGAVVEDNYEVVAKDADTVPASAAILPLALWLEKRGELQDRNDIGVWLDSDESPKGLVGAFDGLALIAINFPAFADGRGFTYGRELREQHGWTGEMRAIGNFMRDQLFSLHRLGFNSYALQGVDLTDALNSLDDFSVNYQPDVLEKRPLFRRRG